MGLGACRLPEQRRSKPFWRPPLRKWTLSTACPGVYGERQARSPMSSLVMGDSLPDLGIELPLRRTSAERSSLCRKVRAFGGTRYRGAHVYFPNTQVLCADIA